MPQFRIDRNSSKENLHLWKSNTPQCTDQKQQFWLPRAKISLWDQILGINFEFQRSQMFPQCVVYFSSSLKKEIITPEKWTHLFRGIKVKQKNTKIAHCAAGIFQHQKQNKHLLSIFMMSDVLSIKSRKCCFEKFISKCLYTVILLVVILKSVFKIFHDNFGLFQ